MIILKAIERKDLETIRQWRNTWKSYFRQYKELTEADQEKWFNSDFRGTDIMFGIYENNENNKLIKMITDDIDYLIGVCGLTYIDWKNRNADLSLYIGETYVDERALEALNLLFNYGFNELGLERIYNDLLIFDLKKRDILETAGMKIEGEMKNRYFKQGTYYNAVMLGITKEDWSK